MSRQQQDEHAARSHQRAAAAWAAGKFDSQVVPVDTIWKDPKTVSDTRHMQFDVVGMALLNIEHTAWFFFRICISNTQSVILAQFISNYAREFTNIRCWLGQWHLFSCHPFILDLMFVWLGSRVFCSIICLMCKFVRLSPDVLRSCRARRRRFAWTRTMVFARA